MLAAGVALLFAADPVWKTKPASQWNEDDAKQVLAGSPWVKRAVVALLPELTAQQRKEGGATGGGKGVGLDGLGATPDPVAPRSSQPKQTFSLNIRWESAFPVRTAELKAHDFESPDWDGEAYVLAVYDVPDLKVGANQKAEAALLKQVAFLKREGKKDLKPSSVELMQEPNGLAIVVYVFPRTPEISLEDERVEFVAQINRLSLAQYFFPAEMELQGKLEL
jgi:hypothetical protein